MKILVATLEKQGLKDGDFTNVAEGELVRFPAVTDNSCKCGCTRAMIGMDSNKGTTTFKVIESDMTPRDYCVAIVKSLIASGWVEKANPEAGKIAREEMAELLSTAKVFPVGSVLEKTATTVRVRK